MYWAESQEHLHIVCDCRRAAGRFIVVLCSTNRVDIKESSTGNLMCHVITKISTLQLQSSTWTNQVRTQPQGMITKNVCVWTKGLMERWKQHLNNSSAWGGSFLLRCHVAGNSTDKGENVFHWIPTDSGGRRPAASQEDETEKWTMIHRGPLQTKTNWSFWDRPCSPLTWPEMWNLLCEHNRWKLQEEPKKSSVKKRKSPTCYTKMMSAVLTEWVRHSYQTVASFLSWQKKLHLLVVVCLHPWDHILFRFIQYESHQNICVKS